MSEIQVGQWCRNKLDGQVSLVMATRTVPIWSERRKERQALVKHVKTKHKVLDDGTHYPSEVKVTEWTPVAELEECEGPNATPEPRLSHSLGLVGELNGMAECAERIGGPGALL